MLLLGVRSYCTVSAVKEKQRLHRVDSICVWSNDTLVLFTRVVRELPYSKTHVKLVAWGCSRLLLLDELCTRYVQHKLLDRQLCRPLPALHQQPKHGHKTIHRELRAVTVNDLHLSSNHNFYWVRNVQRQQWESQTVPVKRSKCAPRKTNSRNPWENSH